MDNLNLNKHISGQFNAELEYIRTQVMTMGGLVEQQLSDAITAMHNQDSDLAKRVIDGDKQVNMMEVAIDEACVRIIAKRQPTASDLRLVMAIIKTIAELERIGDVADKICRTALEKFSQQHQPLLVSLESLGRHTVQMLHDVLDAFARMDLDEAVRIYREDKKVDQEYEGIVRQLMTYMMEDSRTIPSVLTAPSSVSATAARISANIFSTSSKVRISVTLAAMSWINCSLAKIRKSNNHSV